MQIFIEKVWIDDRIEGVNDTKAPIQSTHEKRRKKKKQKSDNNEYAFLIYKSHLIFILSLYNFIFVTFDIQYPR